jgi:glycerophosphoryl diester phosphodiesterase
MFAAVSGSVYRLTLGNGHTALVPVPFLDHQRPVAFAHRGGAAHNPENSWPAFEHAVKLGYAYLETDARATSDGKLLAFHDATLERVTGQQGTVARLPYEQVAKARIGQGDGGETIPLIEDLLGSWPDVRFNIDVKHAGSIRPLAKVLSRTRAWDRVCVTSFSGRRLRAAVAAIDHPVCRAVTPAAIAALRYAGRPGAALAARLARSGANCAQVPQPVATTEFIGAAQNLGLQVHVWTLNTRQDIEQALDRGADGVMTDQTVLLREILIERSQWHPRAGMIPGE